MMPNAIVEYVRHFVDEDFGWAIGIAYWLTYSSIFAAQNMTAAQLSEYWGGPDPPQVYRTVIFYVVAPIIMLVINVCGVSTFGWIESIGGGLKISLVFTTTFALYVMAAKQQNNYLQDSFQHNEGFINNNVAAVCYVIPIMAFGFIGIETVAVTAFEAAPNHLRRPSKYITYFTAILYLLCMLSQCLNVEWTNDHLPMVYGGVEAVKSAAKRAADDPDNPFSRVLAVIAMFNWNQKIFAGVLNGAIIFSVLSASNTTLYLASRTLYGMALRVKDPTILGKLVHALSTVDSKTGVPLSALLLSWAMFFWIPFMSLKNDYRVQYVIEIIQTASSVSCLIVWTALVLAYLRLWYWQTKYKTSLGVEVEQMDGSRVRPYDMFERGSPRYKPHTVLMSLQPLPAMLALVGCFVIFAFCSATWWYRLATFPKVAIAYAAQFIVLIIFAVLKATRIWRLSRAKRRQWWNSLWSQTSSDTFTEKLNSLRGFLEEAVEQSKEDRRLRRQNSMDDRRSGNGDPVIALTEQRAVAH
ncbi:hypothetical protein SLS61_003230 [Didymella pomorum]